MVISAVWVSRETLYSLTPGKMEDRQSVNERDAGSKTWRDPRVKATLLGGRLWLRLTIEFLEDALHGTRAAAAAHADVELVVMVRHLGYICGWGCSVDRSGVDVQWK